MLGEMKERKALSSGTKTDESRVDAEVAILTVRSTVGRARRVRGKASTLY